MRIAATIATHREEEDLLRGSCILWRRLACCGVYSGVNTPVLVSPWCLWCGIEMDVCLTLLCYSSNPCIMRLDVVRGVRSPGKYTAELSTPENLRFAWYQASLCACVFGQAISVGQSGEKNREKPFRITERIHTRRAHLQYVYHSYVWTRRATVELMYVLV